ncbi:MAG: carbamoyltransferase HypF [Terracidiphilus sp.]|nr:carbamoyltransferase HypF [Terracidiphilus sp.]
MSDALQSGQQRIRRAVLVQGVVQGVGFRPFVYRLATEEQLAGSIGNDTDGVTIELEGPPARIDAFLVRLRQELPPLARIDGVVVRDIPVVGEKEFRIVSSQVKGQVSTGIPADAATCPDCLRELLDPSDRRYRYPFLNCTNCGPRFTITRRIPYDRPQTSMARFKMCAACQAEYDDPLNRRFHAQPNACSVCGPQVWLESASGMRIETADAVTEGIERLLAGEVAAIKGIGGFHLCVDATNETAVGRLRERKHRYGKPLAVMVRDLDAARELCTLTPEEEDLLRTPARPIVLARSRDANCIAPSVAPGIPWLGVYLPYAPLQHLLFADVRVRALVMTSANLSEEPIAIDNEEARARLGSIADVFLMHDREILQRCDDSVAAIVDGAPQLVRRARGYVPLSVPLPVEVPPLLAVGGHLKNVFTLARGRSAYQSQHLGDLENLTGLEFFEHSLAHLMHTFEVEPEFVAHDLHPGYLSTTWAQEWAARRGLPTYAVQHHHAHVVACMAENGLAGSAIGLSLDGTGYGTDGHIWGGEVLEARLDGFVRLAHLSFMPMPGGEAAIREPWRMALGALHGAGIDSADACRLVGAKEHDGRLLLRMMERGINTPSTSSCGRLFDAAAAIVLGRRVVDYEAQAAIELEGIAVDEPDVEPYPTEIIAPDGSANSPATIRTSPLWSALIRDLSSGVPGARIAAHFHAGVANAFVQAAIHARTTTGISQVVMSGGCMHNRRLARLLREGLEREGFAVFAHRSVSPGDGGLSYGQAVVAAAMRSRES